MTSSIINDFLQGGRKRQRSNPQLVLSTRKSWKNKRNLVYLNVNEHLFKLGQDLFLNFQKFEKFENEKMCPKIMFFCFYFLKLLKVSKAPKRSKKLQPLGNH